MPTYLFLLPPRALHSIASFSTCTFVILFFILFNFNPAQALPGCPSSVELTSTSPGIGTVGVLFEQTFIPLPPSSANDSTGIELIINIQGSLPPGVWFVSTTDQPWTIKGTPTMAGTFEFNVTVVAGANSTYLLCPGTWPFAIRVDCPSMSVALRNSGSQCFENQPCTQQVVANPTSFAWNYTLDNSSSSSSSSVELGSLPSGMVLHEDGSIRGSPSSAMNASFVVRAQSSNCVTTGRLVFLVCRPINLDSAETFYGSIFTQYSTELRPSGGVGPLTLQIIEGSLPEYFKLDPISGRITFFAVVAEQIWFTVRVVDSLGCSAMFSRSLKFGCPPPANYSMELYTMLKAKVNLLPFIATPGKQQFGQIGELPDGLKLDSSTGVISGRTAVAGKFGFTLTAMDTRSACKTVARYFVVVTETAYASASRLVPWSFW